MIQTYHDGTLSLDWISKYVYFIHIYPKWPQVLRFLKRNLYSEDRLDILSQIFHIKLANILREFDLGKFLENLLLVRLIITNRIDIKLI